MIETARNVQVWLGTFPDRGRFDAYFEEFYDGDGSGDRPISQFAADMDASFYDHDFLETGFFNADGGGDLMALLAGHSYNASYRQEVVAAWAATGSHQPVNTVVLMFDEHFSAPVSAAGDGYALHYLGEFAWSDDRPEPATPAMPTVAHSGRILVARYVTSQLAVTGAHLAEVMFWNPAAGKPLESQAPAGLTKENWTHAIASSADGRRVVTVSTEVVLWNLTAGASATPVGTLLGDDGGYQCQDVAITSDGLRAVSACVSGTLKVWDLNSRRETLAFQKHEGRVVKVLMIDDQTSASCTDGGELLVWNINSGEVLQRADIGGCPRVFQFSPSTTLIIAGLSNGDLVGWRYNDGTSAFQATAHQGGLTDLDLSPDGLRGVSAGADMTLKLWNLRTGELERCMKGHTATVGAVAMSYDHGFVFSGSRGATIRVWSLATGGELARLQTGPADRPPVQPWMDDPYEIGALAVSPDGSTLVAGETSGRVHMIRWNGETFAIA